MAFITDMTEKAQRGIRNLETPTFDNKPWVVGPSMSERKVTMISSAGLHLRSDQRFIGMDSSYRAIPSSADPSDVLMGHVSTNFDRTGFIQDINVAYPIELLRSLVDEGFIGSMADAHYSFMGGAYPMDMEDHARALAAKLREEGVDTALFVPTCPHCTRAVSVLAHFLEEEGIATTVVGLLRELIERAAPPRAIWVPFEMGRPLGNPFDRDTQMSVMKAALGLLDRQDGPGIIEDFDGDISKKTSDWKPAVVTSRTDAPASDIDAFRVALAAELETVAPHRAAALQRLGRSSFGNSALLIEKINELLLSYLAEAPIENPNEDFSPLLTLRFAMDDIKTFYFEAAVSETSSPQSVPMEDWFWKHTVAGQLLIELRDLGLRGSDPKFERVSTNFTMPHKYVVELNLRSVDNAPLPGK
ncbi:hypothetical protein NBRC116601_34730 [Cognatishimia sp. WU-CL00825]|uniref:glycine/sarcosine/betaine reductase selenoprotein B family protein n=1 Tax=Cognatishimia sp. WU-CL00825 TaxID=3127658 RepID=UPI0031087595